MLPNIQKNIFRSISVESTGSLLKSSLKTGDILNGRIVKAVEPGKYIIEIKNSNFLAESDLEFSEDDKVYLKVVSTSPKLELQIMRAENILQTEEAKVLFLKKLGIEPTKINIEILEVLKENKFPLTQRDIVYIGSLIKSFLLDNRKRVNRDRILAVILLYKRGVKIEADLIDEIESLLRGEESYEKIVRIFKKIIEKTSNPAEKDNFPAYLNFPLSAETKKEFAEIFFFRENGRKKRSGPETLTLHIFLKLITLGSIKIQLNVIEKRLDLQFYFEDKDVLEFFKKYENILNEKLSALELKIERITYQKGKDISADRVNTFFRIIERDIKNVDLKI